MNQNLSICQHYTWIHWPAAQQACPEGSRATPGRSNVSFFLFPSLSPVFCSRHGASPGLLDFAEYRCDSDHTGADSAALNYRHPCVALSRSIRSGLPPLCVCVFFIVSFFQRRWFPIPNQRFASRRKVSALAKQSCRKIELTAWCYCIPLFSPLLKKCVCITLAKCWDSPKL